MTKIAHEKQASKTIISCFPDEIIKKEAHEKQASKTTTSYFSDEILKEDLD